ncbi:ROK family protein [Kribbella italica]|uniref:Glucokinase n=1 Tax=Kribbella italica TaxID=1540520 RepID=A0A7W9JED1_9ACTN|nr:ROK family protein [Kribbella italica]MBB5840606.1 glucokinase [Kribbella italica]
MSDAVLGVDIGGTRIKWVRWSPASGIVDEGERETPQSGSQDVVSAVAALIRSVPVEAAGVAVPGHLSTDRSAVRLLPNLPGEWSGLRLAEKLSARTGARVRLVNDARAFALAELRLGAAREYDDVLFVTMGTGIGGALALNGRILHARGDVVGELGHMICRSDGLPCGCGAYGCLETVAGGRALVARVRAGGGHAETPQDVVRAAIDRDGLERTVLAEAGQALGTTLSNVIAYTGVTSIVIGGGVAPAFAFMRPAVEAQLAGRARLVGPVDLRFAQLGARAGAIGAALLVTPTSASPTPGDNRYEHDLDLSGTEDTGRGPAVPGDSHRAGRRPGRAVDRA